MTDPPKITLYTNHGCPWAQRVHIALKELGLSYEEIIIDLDVPREPWFLSINPRGVVPALKYIPSPTSSSPTATITESAIIASFLTDAHPSHLLPTPGSNGATPLSAALFRARAAFFVDAFFTRAIPVLFAIMRSPSADEREAKAAELVEIVKKEIEPLLPAAASAGVNGEAADGAHAESGGQGTGPFFGGSEQLTLAEVQTASFVLRMFDFSDGVVFPIGLAEGLDGLPRFGHWARRVRGHESVVGGWEKEEMLGRFRDRLWKSRPGFEKPVGA